MNGLLQHLRISLRLHFRNKMALIYGYLFPVIFLIAFWVLYRYERVPLARHMGELLTVTILGGACFGLPTTMVSERERGVWRRFRLAPIATGALIMSTVAARYVAVISAGLLQLAIAMGVGMPLPRHPLELWVAFTFVTFAFLGLGLVIAMLADNVPAVQALGQCIFLPMLIIGGVAVQLSSLPDWALHVSAFFPGRYAVEAMQACVTGSGLAPVRFSLLALTLIGVAGCLAGAKMFRWDAQQRFAARSGKGWVAVAIGAWFAVGFLAEWRGHIGYSAPPEQAAASTGTAAIPRFRRNVLVTPKLSDAERAAASPSTPGKAEAPTGAVAPARSGTETPAKTVTPPPATTPKAIPSPPQAASAPNPPPLPAAAGSQPTLCPSAPGSWQAVTPKNIDDDLTFDKGLPPDSSIVTPIARDDQQPDPDVADKLQTLVDALPRWNPGKVIDPVQKVRNYLYAAAVPDVFQLDVERFVPWYVFDQIVQEIPKDDLVKILYWIACTPDRGADPAAEDMRALGLPGLPGDMEEIRNRAAIYGVKLLGRVLGKIK